MRLGEVVEVIELFPEELPFLEPEPLELPEEPLEEPLELPVELPEPELVEEAE